MPHLGHCYHNEAFISQNFKNDNTPKMQLYQDSVLETPSTDICEPQYRAVVLGRLWDCLLSTAVLYNGHI